jgi:hypothetical protein
MSFVKTIVTAFGGVAVGYIAHQTDPYITKLEEGANRPGWYLIVRYTIGILTVMFFQQWAMAMTLPERTYTKAEVIREAGLSLMASSMMVGGGVVVARFARALQVEP